MPKAEAKVRARLFGLFEQGLSAAAARKRDRRLKVSYATVLRVWHEWERSKVAAATATAGEVPAAQAELFAPAEAAEPEAPQEVVEESKPAAVHGGRNVRHLGTWILLGRLEREGVYESAQEECGGEHDWPGVQLALDAVVAALALGQRCVEGVRRLEAPSAGVLLRARATSHCCRSAGTTNGRPSRSSAPRSIG